MRGLRRRSIRFVKRHPEAERTVYRVPGTNESTITADTFRGCVEELGLSQITATPRTALGSQDAPRVRR
jgi:hypothetical protein